MLTVRASFVLLLFAAATIGATQEFLKPSYTIGGPAYAREAGEISPDGKKLLSWDPTGLRIYDVPTRSLSAFIGNVLNQLARFRYFLPSDPEGKLSLVGDLSSDGAYVALGHNALPGNPNSRGSLRLFRVGDGVQAERWDNQLVGVGPMSAYFAPNGRTLAFGTDKGLLVAVDTPATIASLTLSPQTVNGGGSSTGTIRLTRTRKQPTVVSLGTTSPVISIPSTVTIPAGQLTATFTINSDVVARTRTADVVAAFSGKVSTTLSINP